MLRRSEMALEALVVQVIIQFVTFGRFTGSKLPCFFVKNHG